MDVALIMMIKDTAYLLTKLDEPAWAWRLRKADGTCHDVHENGHGVECTCGDFVFRKDGTRKLCRHLKALKEIGL